MSVLNNTFQKFSYVWEIKKPQYCTRLIGQFIESPKFCVPQFWNTEWYLKIFPCGDNNESKGSTSCFMYRGQDSGPEGIEIKYTISLSSGSRRFSSRHNFEKTWGWGYPIFLPHPMDVCESSVVIIWEMEFKSQSFHIAEDNRLSCRSDVTFPVKCVAKTDVLFETKSIQRCIDSLISGTCSDITIPLILQDNYPTLVIRLMSSREDIIDFEVSLIDGASTELLTVFCEMSVINNAGQLMHSFKEKHSFAARNGEIWRLTAFINKSHFKKYLSDSSLDKITLNGSFVISMGQAQSEIVSVERIRVSKHVEPSNEYMLSKEMLRLYKENELCDFALKVDDAIFNVHKVVLGATSPVFNAMFKTDMAEKLNNEVDIVDLDKATVEEMISFMYTGSVKELDYDSAKKLFIAGDKYQISPLLDLSRNAIINLINNDNICDIFFTEDTYNDIKLKAEAEKFVKLNKTTVLNSPKWITFERENPNLAAKILRQICLLNKRKRLP